MVKSESAERQLERFLARFSPEVRGLAEHVLPKLRARMPGATQLVYDNYNALVIAFSPSDRTTECLFSIALYPRWVNLFFARGADLPDPKKLLKGSGNAIRHIVLQSPDDLDAAPVKALIKSGLTGHTRMTDPTVPGKLIIKAIASKQRPRRPAGTK